MLLRPLIAFLLSRILRTRIGRWTFTVLLLAVAAICAIAYPQQTQANHALDLLVTACIFGVFGLALLIFTLRLDVLLRRKKTARQDSVQAALNKVSDLAASGKILPIPPLPPTPSNATPEDLARVEDYAKQLADLPWGENPQIPAEHVREIFDRTVARVRRVTGDWSELRDPVNIFVDMPKPLCFVGAAEVMHRLSYLRSRTYAPVGLRQGLRFIARVQYHDPMQPDALVIRVKLLAGGNSKQWLDLADQTLALLKQVAPDHPRLPDAEGAIHVHRGENEAALGCEERIIARPPSPEEEYIARSGKAILLMDLKRYDEALAAYDQALALDPRDPWVWHNKSIALLTIGRYDEALDCNTHALSIMDFSMAHYIRERILEKQAAASGA